jgi:hypothetical protein
LLIESTNKRTIEPKKEKTMKTKYPIIENAKRQARMIFKGIAVPMLVEIPDDKVVDDVDYVYGVNDQKRYVVSEKVLKFNRTALKNLGKVRKEKADPRYVGGQDTMIVPVGKPGSRERVEELTKQYGAVAHLELSPFSFKSDDE